MRRLLIVLLAASLAGCGESAPQPQGNAGNAGNTTAPASAREPQPDPVSEVPEEPPAAPTSDHGDRDWGQDVTTLYRQVGRFWRTQMVTEFSGLPQVLFCTDEVIEVYESSAEVKHTLFNSDGEEIGSQIQTKDFGALPDPAVLDGNVLAYYELSEDTLLIDGVYRVCLKVAEKDGGPDQEPSTQVIDWYSKRYPGMHLKRESSSTDTVERWDVTEFKTHEIELEIDLANTQQLYKKVGRSWTVKNVSEIQGQQYVSYLKTEVVEFDDARVVLSTTTMGADKLPMGPAQPSEISLADPGAVDTSAMASTSKETIEVEAGSFACLKIEMSGTTSWISQDYPELLVKVEHAAGYAELIEFNE